jgi:acyl transferase domain-containing protein/NAD(P)-dependent dehydrogenase (short-subunit alcohol dehydrogenase family)/acyl carrier protein
MTQPPNNRDGHPTPSQVLSQAIVEMRQLRSHIALLESQLAKATAPAPPAPAPPSPEPIAIIGMACRFPQAPDLHSYWQNLKTGHCAVQPVPADRWDVEQFYSADPTAAGKMYTRSGCFIEQPGEFDAGFFSISPREAIAMDPQQRLLLETTHRTIEQAGIPVESLRGSKTGVYIGLCFDDYARLSVASGDRTKIDAFGSLGNTRSIAAGRIAYSFGLQGTTMQLDTTCSSSLLAVHLASQALRQGEIEMALVGGVNLMLTPDVTIGFCQLKALAADGHSKAFDASADGYGRGEGCGMVMLKRLKDAQRDGNQILAVIQGSAANHDGSSNGLTAPNGQAQVAVMQAAIANAQQTNPAITAASVQYLEAHGTGTILGDPIEVGALQQAYGLGRSQPLKIGSVKANIGHLESAAGIAGLIKLVLAMQHRTFPPQPNYHQPNPHIPWSEIAIQVNQTSQPWEGEPMAGISSFGMSGTNVHLILTGGAEFVANGSSASASSASASSANASSPEAGPADLPLAPSLLCLSAKSENALRALMQRYVEHFQAYAELDLPAEFAAFCRACLTQRSHFSHRFSCVVGDRTEAIARLQQALATHPEAPPAPQSSVSQTDIAEFQAQTADAATLHRLSHAYVNRGDTAADIDWSALFPPPQPPIALPEYPFQKQHYWVEPVVLVPPDPPSSLALGPSDPSQSHPLLGQRLNLAQTQAHYFTQVLSREALPYLGDHAVAGRAILPTSGLIELLWAGLTQIAPSAYQLEHLKILQPLVIEQQPVQIQTRFTPVDSADCGEILSCELFYYDPVKQRWIQQASAQARAILRGFSSANAALGERIDLSVLQQQCPIRLDIPGYYQQCRQVGLDYGPLFQVLTQLAQGEDCAVAQVRLPEALRDQGLKNQNYILHPVLLDGCLQAIGAALPVKLKQQQVGLVPIGCDRVICHQPCQASEIYALVQLISAAPSGLGTIAVNLQAVDPSGAVMIDLQGLTLQVLSAPSQRSQPNWLYQVMWEPVEIEATLVPEPAAHSLAVLADSSLNNSDLDDLDLDDLDLDDLDLDDLDLERLSLQSEMLLQAGLVARADACIEAGAIAAPGFDLSTLLTGSTLEPGTRILYYATQTEPASVYNLLHWVQALLKSSQPVELVIVTQGSVDAGAVNAGAVSAGGADIAREHLGGAGLWGLAKTLRLEHPQLTVRCIDLAPGVPPQPQLAGLTHALRHSSLPDLALRHGPGRRYYRPRLKSFGPAASEPYQLAIAQRGDLESLTLAPRPRRSPDSAAHSSEIEIRVLATGLNFRDVLNALDLYPGEAGALGCECVGEVVALGQDVQHLQLGDRVIALAQGSYSQYVTLPASLAIRAPAHLAPSAAASIGVAFLTAHYALCHLANLQPGERVLIHAAAGAVGQAAIQIAQAVGATVYATASPQKWDLLRSLGVQQVFNSREVEFGTALLQATQGKRLDAVLNCLSGEFIPASLHLLKPTGAFLELGKVGIWSADQVQQAYPEVRYHPIDLVALCQQSPDLVQQLLQAVMQQFNPERSEPNSRFSPISTTVFPIHQAKSAFRLMQQGLHQGKLVLTAAPSRIGIRGDRSYLITGGTGGLGLAIAALLAAEGAQHLTLVARHQPSPQAMGAIQALLETGVSVTVALADGRDRRALAQVLADLPKPLAGVIHAAGVLVDGLIAQQTLDQFAAVVDTKVATAQHLHELTQHQSLDFFYLFSSATAIFGSPGQSNHVVANAQLDALAQHRHRLGLPALSINWGLWADIGSAAAPEVTAQMAQRGMRSMPPAQCLQIFKSLLEAPPAHSQIAIMDVDWPKIRQRDWSGFLDAIEAGGPAVVVSELDTESAHPESVHPKTLDSEILQLIRQSDRAAAILHLEDYLKARLCKILGFQATDLKVDTGFFDLGMDSLTSVELSNRLQEDLNYTLSSTAAFDYPTIHTLATYLTDQIQARSNLAAPTAPPVDAIENLSTADIARLLQQELFSIKQEQEV